MYVRNKFCFSLPIYVTCIRSCRFINIILLFQLEAVFEDKKGKGMTESVNSTKREERQSPFERLLLAYIGEHNMKSGGVEIDFNTYPWVLGNVKCVKNQKY